MRLVLYAMFGLLLALSISEARVIRLKNSQMLQGEVVEHFVDGILFERWDNGGIIQLTWEHLEKEEAEKLKLEFGYVLKEDMLVTRKASRVFLKSGNFVEGRLFGDYRKKSKVRLSNATTNLILYASDIHRVQVIEMNILDLYTPQEIYDGYVKKHDLSSAYAEFEFGEYLRNLQLFELAIKHYKLAQEKDSSFEPKVRALIENLESLLKDKELQNHMANLYGKINQNKFRKGFELIIELESFYSGNEKVLGLLVKAKEDNEKKRDNFLKDKVPFAYYQLVRSLIRKISFKRRIEFSDAKSYVEGSLEKEVQNKLAKRYEVEAELIEKAFTERTPNNNKKASFNSGTFIQGLGTDGKSESPENSDGGSVGLEQQIAEFLNNNAKGKKGKRGQGGGGGGQAQQKAKLQSPETWWKFANGTARYQWLLAYYSERKMKVQDYYFKPCSNCASKGFTVVSSAAGTQKRTCQRCHGLKYDKGVLFK